MRPGFPLKASAPTAVTVRGMVSVVSLLPAKARFPMDVIFGGMVTAVIPRLAKADAGRAVSDGETVRVLLTGLPVASFLTVMVPMVFPALSLMVSLVIVGWGGGGGIL